MIIFGLPVLSELDILSSACSEILALACVSKVLLHTCSVSLASSSYSAEVSSLWRLALESSRDCVEGDMPPPARGCLSKRGGGRRNTVPAVFVCPATDYPPIVYAG